MTLRQSSFLALAVAALMTIGCGSDTEPTEPTQPTSPAHREHHAVTYDPTTRRVLVHAGLSRLAGGATRTLDDLWSWDGTRWTAITAANGRQALGHLLFADGTGSIFVATAVPSVFTARWNGSQWTVLPTSSNTPTIIAGAAGAYDSRRGRFVMFGGSVGPAATPSGVTWEFDGQEWRQVATSGPPARMSTSMVYDSQRGVTVLFGGDTRTSYLGDTWEWDGTRWTSVAATGPAPRTAAAMVYDSERNAVVVNGGADAQGPHFDDTWVLSGSAWRRVDTPGPAARSGAYMAFDASRGVAVLFGGCCRGDLTFGDTWEWNGQVWRQALP